MQKNLRLMTICHPSTQRYFNGLTKPLNDVAVHGFKPK